MKARIKEQLLQECELHTIVRLPGTVFAPYTTIATNLLFFTKGRPTKEVWYYEHRLPVGTKAYNKTKPINVDEFDVLRAWWTDRQESDVAWRVDIDEIKARDYNLDFRNPAVIAARDADPLTVQAIYDEQRGAFTAQLEKIRDSLAAALEVQHV